MSVSEIIIKCVPLWKWNAPPVRIFRRRPWVWKFGWTSNWLQSMFQSPDCSSPGLTADTVSVVRRRVPLRHTEDCVWKSCGRHHVLKWESAQKHGSQCEKPPVSAMSVEGMEGSLFSGRRYERVWQEHEAQAEAMGFIFTRQRQIRLPPRRGEVVYYCFSENWSCVNKLLLSLCLQVGSRLADRVYDVSRSLLAYYNPF